MPDVEVDLDILAPPARVWAVLMDVDRWPEWTPTVIRVKRLDPAPLRIGSCTRIRQPKLLPAVWQVTQLDEEEGIFIWRSRFPGIVIAAGHHVEATTTGSHVTLALVFSDSSARSWRTCCASRTSATSRSRPTASKPAAKLDLSLWNERPDRRRRPLLAFVF